MKHLEKENIHTDVTMHDTKGERDRMLEMETLHKTKSSEDDSDQVLETMDNPKNLTPDPKCKEDEEKLCSRLKNDKLFRKKYILTIAYIASFLTLGWVEGQIGPSFPELRFIANTTLEKGSLFFTMNTVGYLLGAVLSGFLFDKQKLERNLLMFILIAGYGVVIVIIPWCGQYVIMAVIHVVKGLFGGGLDTCGNAGLVVIWGRESDTYFNALHFTFALGAILSPLATAPFLMPRDDSVFDAIHNRSDEVLNSTAKTYSDYSVDVKNSINFTQTSPGVQESIIYIPYTMSAALCIITSLPFLIFCCTSLQKSLDAQKESEVDDRRKTQKKLRIAGFIIMTIYLGMFIAVIRTFSGFLTTFVMSGLHWTNFQGSYITSGHYGLFAFGRFLGIFFVRFFSPGTIIFTSTSLMLLSLLGFLMTSLFESATGVWIFALAAGFSVSPIFPVTFMWTEKTFLPVTGKIASIFLVSCSLGFLVNPPLAGILMDEFTPMWFCYLLFGETIVLLLLYFVALFISRRIARGEPRRADAELIVSKGDVG